MYIVAVLEYIAADILKVIMFDINLIQNQLSVEYRYNDFFFVENVQNCFVVIVFQITNLNHG